MHNKQRRCGASAFRIDLRPVRSPGLCHCRDIRHWVVTALSASCLSTRLRITSCVVFMLHVFHGTTDCSSGTEQLSPSLAMGGWILFTCVCGCSTMRRYGAINYRVHRCRSLPTQNFLEKCLLLAGIAEMEMLRRQISKHHKSFLCDNRGVNGLRRSLIIFRNIHTN